MSAYDLLSAFDGTGTVCGSCGSTEKEGMHVRQVPCPDKQGGCMVWHGYESVCPACLEKERFPFLEDLLKRIAYLEDRAHWPDGGKGDLP